METKFIEQLVMTVPESLRETTLALQTEVEELLKAKSTKKFLVLKYHYDRLGLDKMFEFGDELIIDGLERDVCAIVLFAHEFYQVTDRPLITQYRAFRIFLVHQFPVLLIMLIECFNQHFG